MRKSKRELVRRELREVTGETEATTDEVRPTEKEGVPTTVYCSLLLVGVYKNRTELFG